MGLYLLLLDKINKIESHFKKYNLNTNPKILDKYVKFQVQFKDYSVQLCMMEKKLQAFLHKFRNVYCLKLTSTEIKNSFSDIKPDLNNFVYFIKENNNAIELAYSFLAKAQKCINDLNLN